MSDFIISVNLERLLNIRNEVKYKCKKLTEYEEQ